MLEALLSSEYRVITSEEAKEAINLIGQSDLIVTDILMPGTTGLEFLKEIRSIYEKPIIVLSGAAVSPEMVFEYGANLFIEKPCSPEALLDYIKNLIEKN